MAKKRHMTPREWATTWNETGKALAEIRREELRSPEYGSDWQVIDGMLEWTCTHGEERKTSGLVEQQALFRKLRERRRR